jgi:hypothetical protein
MTFDAQGHALWSSKLDQTTRAKLNLDETLKLRWITGQHEGFLDWHRTKVFSNT